MAHSVNAVVLVFIAIQVSLGIHSCISVMTVRMSVSVPLFKLIFIKDTKTTSHALSHVTSHQLFRQKKILPQV